MTTRHTLSALVGIAITLGTARVTAGQDIAPYYDEESDTVVYNFVGGPVSSVGSQASVHAKDRTHPYYDEDTDTVVYHFTGDPVTPSRPRLGACGQQVHAVLRRGHRHRRLPPCRAPGYAEDRDDGCALIIRVFD